MQVIGTAGHVDHGKSTLVEALTGIHPDRLKEEHEREMTIDLGFGWMELPSGEEVGIVDVPGHRDFIENMLAGVGGIDAALFVVAADEGVMPQTREHLAILDTLQIQGGVVALTKTDMVDDLDWLTLVEEDVRQVLSGTTLENARIIRVSARKREGIGELIQRVERRVNEITEVQRLAEERFRQEWVTFKADDQKRWTNYTLTQEEQRGEIVRNFEKMVEQITHLDDTLQELQDLIQQMNAQTEKRLQSLLAGVHDWVADYERLLGRGR